MALAAVGAGIGAAGSALGAVGSLNQANSNANIAIYNSENAINNANTTTEQGAEAARRSLVNSRKTMGQETAAYGASGVTGNGSAAWVLRNSAAQGELNALTITNAAAIKAQAFTNEANLDIYRAGNDKTSGYIGAASSLLKGASSLAGGASGGGGSSSGDSGVEAD